MTSRLFVSPNLARRDLTGGADLGARLPAAGSLHRAGCEDGRAGQRQDPSAHTGHFSSFHAISQNIHSYRELMTNDSSIRRFLFRACRLGPLVHFLAHPALHLGEFRRDA